MMRYVALFLALFASFSAGAAQYFPGRAAADTGAVTFQQVDHDQATNFVVAEHTPVRQAATDCTAETGGATGELCQELDDNTLYVCETGPCNGSGWVAFGGGGGGASELSDLSDVGVTTPTNLNALMADGDSWESRALADADIPDDITVDLATVATTANAGDSATAFFSAGTIEHERGGLEADVSAYAGLILISTGSTSAVTDLAGLNTALGSSIADGAHTANTDAESKCVGNQILEGDGDCVATPAGGGGDVTGPASSVAAQIATFDGTSGKLIQDGGSTIANVQDRTNHTGTQAWTTITGEPTTLAGYGITDGATDTELSTHEGTVDAHFDHADSLAELNTQLGAIALVDTGTLTDTKFCTWDLAGSEIDCNSEGGAGAPTDATYITQTADATLSAEQALSALSTGIMRVAATTGVITSLTDSAGIFANISDETGSGVMVGGTSPVFTTQITLSPEAAPTTDADGEIAVDTDGWGSGYDAIEFFNGTASAYVVATTASDTPTNGQVPKWNTGGPITWEDDVGGAWDGDIADIDLDGGTDIGADLVDADLFLVDDGAGGTNRKSTVLRLKKYIGERIIWRITNDVSPITSGTDDHACFYLSEAFTLTGVYGSLNGVGSTSGTTTIDINEGGTTVLSTKLTIDYSESTSATAVTAAVISDSALAANSQICAEIDAVTGGADETGLVVTLKGY